MKFARSRDRRRALGAAGERAACRLLAAKDYEILARDWRLASGELDIVARDGRTIVFVEVKTLRKPRGDSRPADNLHYDQCRRLRRAARAFMKTVGSPELPIRFDLIELVRGRFGWLRVEHHCGALTL
ncbi:MAG: YraN family protein [Victivallaceae bacterium]|nr:YraN family protein [Victivallaceae bacterium]